MSTDLPTDLHYTVEHEWLQDGSPSTIGITAVAADALGDIVYLELPAVGEELVGGRGGGRDRVDEVRLRAVLPGLRDRRRDQPVGDRRPLRRQLRPVRRGLAPEGRRHVDRSAPDVRRVRRAERGLTSAKRNCRLPCRPMWWALRSPDRVKPGTGSHVRRIRVPMRRSLWVASEIGMAGGNPHMKSWQKWRHGSRLCPLSSGTQPRA